MFSQQDTAMAQLLDQTFYAQPALFALGTALHRLFTHAGITRTTCSATPSENSPRHTPPVPCHCPTQPLRSQAEDD
ncbi:hypothetical protein OIO89_01155 (plasmid) [Mycobacterium ulcerans]|nr:hypothetical protein OIO89_01155 [Mycobacterium ulcerans]